MFELADAARTVGEEVHLHPVSLRLERGVFNVLLGPTRAGKTSLLRLLAGLDPPTSGRLIDDGRDVTGVSVRRRDVAMVYQQFINYPAMTVRENIASPLKVQRVARGEIDERVARVAGILRLEPYLDRKPLELSGGQQQRVALARAIVRGARLVLLDEPLANLDYKLREELRAELPRLFADSRSVVVYATSDPAEALLLGGMTATMHEGRVTQFGPSHEVYRRPKDVVTARVFSDPPLNLATAGSGVQPALPGRARAMGFRPHHLRLGAGNPGDFRFRVQVSSTEITGSESFVHVTRGGGERWTMLLHGIHHFEAGADLDAHVRPADVLLFDDAGAAISSSPAAA